MPKSARRRRQQSVSKSCFFSCSRRYPPAGEGLHITARRKGADTWVEAALRIAARHIAVRLREADTSDGMEVHILLHQIAGRWQAAHTSAAAPHIAARCTAVRLRGADTPAAAHTAARCTAARLPGADTPAAAARCTAARYIEEGQMLLHQTVGHMRGPGTSAEAALHIAALRFGERRLIR